jgi:hypothetical protein
MRSYQREGGLTYDDRCANSKRGRRSSTDRPPQFIRRTPLAHAVSVDKALSPYDFFRKRRI